MVLIGPRKQENIEFGRGTTEKIFLAAGEKCDVPQGSIIDVKLNSKVAQFPQ